MTTDRVTDEADTMKQLWTHSKDSPPIVWLARLGAVFVAFQIYVYGRWVFSDNFTPSCATIRSRPR